MPRGTVYQQAPSVDSMLREGLDHHNAGRFDEAEACYRRVLGREPRHGDGLNLLGVLLGQTGRHEAALDVLREAVAVDRENPAYHANLGRLLQLMDRLDEAADAYREVLAIRRDDVETLASLGGVLQLKGDVAEAEACYRRALDLQPGLARARYNLGTLLKADGRSDEAVREFERSVALDGQFLEAYYNIAEIRLKQGRHDAALAACDACLGARPGNAVALAYKAMALDALGQRDAVRRLNGMDRFLKAQHVPVPPAFRDLAAFNAALAEHIHAHPSLRYAPPLQATRNGWHTGELLAEPLGPFSHFRDLLSALVEGYLRDLPDDAAHPFTAVRPRRWRATAWAVVMNAQGHQVAHIHGDAYLSGVYYARLPSVVNDPGAGSAGWIEFGRAPEEFHCRVEPEVRLVQPQEGLMVLFPSYLYHRTIPFDSDEERISIAFDILAMD